MASRPRPRSAYAGTGVQAPKNEKWGTVQQTNRGLGHQRVSKDDVDAIVERLQSKQDTKVPDAKRTGALKDSGIMNSHAWRGY